MNQKFRSCDHSSTELPDSKVHSIGCCDPQPIIQLRQHNKEIILGKIWKRDSKKTLIIQTTHIEGIAIAYLITCKNQKYLRSDFLSINSRKPCFICKVKQYKSYFTICHYLKLYCAYVNNTCDFFVSFIVSFLSSLYLSCLQLESINFCS